MKKLDRQKDRRNWFVCVSHDDAQRQHLKESCTAFKRWYWIDHEPDDENGTPHTHFMVMYSGCCYIRTCARLLGIPENFVQFCENHRAYGQYMIHKNSPEKKQYSFDDVHTNTPGLYRSFLADDVDSDVISLFGDLHKLEMGAVTLNDFLEMHFSELQSMPFYQRIRLYETLTKLSVYGVHST